MLEQEFENCDTHAALYQRIHRARIMWELVHTFYLVQYEAFVNGLHFHTKTACRWFSCVHKHHYTINHMRLPPIILRWYLFFKFFARHLWQSTIAIDHCKRLLVYFILVCQSNLVCARLCLRSCMYTVEQQMYFEGAVNREQVNSCLHASSPFKRCQYPFSLSRTMCNMLIKPHCLQWIHCAEMHYLHSVCTCLV
jgi:hypothetical protein